MAISSCVKCGSHSFETTLASPTGSNYKVQFIQCASCGGVVGAMDYYHISTLLEVMAKKLNIGKIT
jgi:hypothetical protein